MKLPGLNNIADEASIRIHIPGQHFSHYKVNVVNANSLKNTNTCNSKTSTMTGCLTKIVYFRTAIHHVHTELCFNVSYTSDI